MARDHLPPAFTKDAAIREYIQTLERRLKLLENRTTATLQRMRASDIDDPIEGEEIIDDVTHKWYADGAWHQAEGGALDSTMLYLNGPGAISGGSVVFFDFTSAAFYRTSSIFSKSPAFTPGNAPTTPIAANRGILATGGGLFYWMLRCQMNPVDFSASGSWPVSFATPLLLSGGNYTWYGTIREPYMSTIDNEKSCQVVSASGYTNHAANHIWLPNIVSPSGITINTVSFLLTRLSDPIPQIS